MPNDKMKEMQECEVLIDLYNKKDFPTVVNFYKVTEQALKNGNDEQNVYKLIGGLNSPHCGYQEEATPFLNLFLEVYHQELLNL